MASTSYIKKIFLALTLILTINFVATGHAELIAAMVIGYILAAFYVVSVAARLESLSQQPKQSSKRKMLFGLFLRLCMLFIVLLVAVKISETIFLTIVACFLLSYVLLLCGLAVYSYKSNI